MATEKDELKVRTPVFRVQYSSVFEMRAYEGGKPKYEVTMLFPKSGPDKADLTTLKKAAKAATLAKYGKASKIPDEFKVPFKDGDKKDWDGFSGMNFVRASSLYAPGVINRNGDKLLSADEFYNGCWGIATVVPYTYDTAGNKGVSFSLRSLIFMRDDEALVGGSSAEDDFDDLIEEGADDDGEDGGAAAPPAGDDGDDGLFD